MKIIVDTREQEKYEFKKYEVEVISETMHTADYTTELLKDKILVERKSVQDAVSSLLSGHDRLSKEMTRAKDYHCIILLIEGTEEDLLTEYKKQYSINKKCGKRVSRGRYIGAIKAIHNTLFGWQVKYKNLKVVFCKDRKQAEKMCYDLLSWGEKYLKKGELV